MEAEQQAQDLLFNLYADFYTFKSATCLPPCKTVEYKAFHRSYDAKSGMDILYLLLMTLSTRGSLVVSYL